MAKSTTQQVDTPATLDEEFKAVAIKYAAERSIDRLYQNMCINKQRLLSPDELKFARTRSQDDAGISHIKMTLLFISARMCQECDTLEGSDINDASAGIQYLTERWEEESALQEVANLALILHFERLAAHG